MIRSRHLALLLFAISHAYAQPNHSASTVVRIAGWTTASERIERIWVVVSSRDGREKYTGDGRDVKLSIPPGEYILQVGAPGFETNRQLLKAYGPAMFRSVALPVAWVHGQAESSLTGTVRNYGGDRQGLRVRLMGLYGAEVWEAVPDARGSFRFPCNAGAYLLLVVADLEKGIAVVDSETVQVPFGEERTVDIDLNGKMGTVVGRPARYASGFGSLGALEASEPENGAAYPDDHPGGGGFAP